MKKSKWFLFALGMSFIFSSCQKDDPIETTNVVVVDFEDVQLGNENYWNGSDGKGEFLANGFRFKNTYVSSDWGDFWSGFACSAMNDTITEGYENQYSTIAGSGAFGSHQFAIAFDDSATILIPENRLATYSAKSIMLTNTTYSYWDMKIGSAFSKKFAADDWFKIIIKGFWKGHETSSLEYFLADFRNGKSFISKEWKEVNISTLGKIDQLSFFFDSSDKGAFGVNTPKYVCIDNLQFEKSLENEE